MMLIQITQADIQAAQATAKQDPLSLALQRLTGSRWRVGAGGVALEQQEPYRYVVMPSLARADSLGYHQTKTMQSSEFWAELKPGQQKAKRRSA